MRGWCVLAAVAGVAACGRPTPVNNIGADAGIDAPGPWALSVSATTIDTAAVAPVTVAITGVAATDVVLGLDRDNAGTIVPSTLTLDANGSGTAIYTPCTYLSPGCLGPANITLAVANNPSSTLTSLGVTLTALTDVG